MIIRLPRRFILLSLIAITAMGLSGCSDPPATGIDLSYLNTPLDAAPPDSEKASFLPLATGNSWDVLSSSQGKQNKDHLFVVGPVNSDGIEGIEVDIQRAGIRWRREVYRANPKSASLVAMQDESSGMMRLNPPIPLFNYPVKEGAALSWKGEFILGKDRFPATGYSRISGHEDVTTPAGKFKTVRLDTIIVVNRLGNEIRFPMVRWLAPGIGFVRRGYAEKGLPAFSEVTKFNVQ